MTAGSRGTHLVVNIVVVNTNLPANTAGPDRALPGMLHSYKAMAHFAGLCVNQFLHALQRDAAPRSFPAFKEEEEEEHRLTSTDCKRGQRATRGPAINRATQTMPADRLSLPVFDTAIATNSSRAVLGPGGVAVFASIALAPPGSRWLCAVCTPSCTPEL